MPLIACTWAFTGQQCGADRAVGNARQLVYVRMAGTFRPLPLLPRPLKDQGPTISAEAATGETVFHHRKTTTG